MIDDNIQNIKPSEKHSNKSYDNDKYLKIEKSAFKNHSLLSDLNEINQIPEQLYFCGNKKLLDAKKNGSKILCVIGSRKATTYGKEAVDYLLSGLASHNIIIVSGLALGIDSCAHKAALKYKIPTITFPGSGLDDEVLYPQTNIKLLEDIINSGGAALSEYAPDSRSQIYYFPARNRLMAAIADLVLVIEAEDKSGTQITARLALDYNKDVAIVPGSIFSSHSRGTAKLFKDGAYPVMCAKDILELLKLDTADQNKNIQSSLFENLSSQEETILKLINSPMQKEDLIENLAC